MRSDGLRVSQFLLFSLMLHALAFAALSFRFLKTEQTVRPIEITLQTAPRKLPPKQVLMAKPVPRMPPPQVAKLVEDPLKQKSVAISNSRKLASANRQTTKEMQKISRRPSHIKKQIPLDKIKNSDVVVKRHDPGTEKLKDIEEGLETLLNTREFKFYNYLNRLKKHVGDLWESQIRQDLSADPSWQSSLAAGLATKLMVRIDRSGAIDQVTILKSCGVENLDAVVLKAFRLASPFNPPPQDLVDPEGGVSITWDFLID